MIYYGLGWSSVLPVLVGTFTNSMELDYSSMLKVILEQT